MLTKCFINMLLCKSLKTSVRKMLLESNVSDEEMQSGEPVTYLRSHSLRRECF